MAKYVEENLLSGEGIIYETHHHWINFFKLDAVFTLFLKPLVNRLTDEFVITNKRIVFKDGWLAVNTWEITLNQIETVLVDQTLWGRMLGFGTVTVIGSGGTKESFRGIAKPKKFRQKFQEVISVS